MAGGNGELQTLNRALLLLSCFSFGKPEWSLTELSQKLGISVSMVHRMLATFEQHSYVVKDEATKRYRLGIRCLEMGAVFREELQVGPHLRPFLEELVQETGESSYCFIRDGDEVICIEKVDSAQTVRVLSRVGMRRPLHAGAAARVFLADQTEAEIERIALEQGMKALTDGTITDVEELKAQAAEVRQSGYAYSCGEVDEDVVGISAPVRDYTESVVAGIGIMAPRFRMKGREDEIIPKVLDKAARVSRSLGYLKDIPAVR